MGKITRKTVFSHLKKWWKLYLLIVILIPIIALINSPTILYEIPQEITKRTGVPINIVAIQKSNAFFRVFDEFNIFHLRKNLYNGDLPIHDLEFSANDIRHFNDLAVKSTEHGSMFTTENTWRSVDLTVNGEKYDVKVKLHGDLPSHWNDNLKSYKVKMFNNSIDGIRKFNLILFEDRLIEESVSDMLSNELDLFDLRDDFVAVRINGVAQGLYYMQEAPDKDYLERNRCSNCVIFKTNDNFIEDHPRGGGADPHGVTDGPGHGTDFDDAISNFRVDGEFQDQSLLFVLDQLYEDIEDNKSRKVASQFDPEYVSSFEAFRLLIGSAHFIHGDNMRLGYSASQGLFYPIPVNEVIFPIPLAKGGVEHSLNEDVPLFEVLARDETIRHDRNRKVYAFIVNEGDRFVQEVDKMVEEYIPYATSYRSNTFSNKYMRYSLRQIPKTLRYNFGIIRKNLEYAKAYVGVVQEANRVSLKVSPDSIAQIKFDALMLNLSQSYDGDVSVQISDESGEVISSKRVVVDSGSTKIDITSAITNVFFSAGLDEEMYPARRDYFIDAVFEDAVEIHVNDVSVEMSNDITGMPIVQDDIYLQIANANRFYDKEISFSEFREKYPNLRWEFANDILALQSGTYSIHKDLIIPEFSGFIIEPSTTLVLGPDVSIVSYSPIDIQGSMSSPVVVKAQNPSRPFGTFGVLHNGGSASISGLDISGGNEAIINGVYFSGALSIHGLDVTMRDSFIHANNADDGLNIKYGDVLIDNVEFENNFADQFDCDFCDGVIKNSDFRSSRDINGDGLDFSGSNVLVEGNSFANFRDKGMSIGENTDVIVFDNVFSNNRLGAAVKDASHAFFLQNVFKHNEVSVSSYKKKDIFGGGFSYNYDNSYEGNDKNFEKDDLSKNFNLNIQQEDIEKINLNLDKEDVSGLFGLLEKYKHDAQS